MSIDIGRALGEGVDRTASRNGLTFAGLAYVLAVVGWSVLGSSSGLGLVVGVRIGLPGAAAREPVLGLPLTATVAVGIGLLLAGVAVLAAALRTFAAGDGERLTLARFTRNYPGMVAHLLAGWLLQTMVVGVFWLLIAGLVFLGILAGLSGESWGAGALVVALGVALLLVVPALLLLEGLYFWYVFVVVDDRGVLDAFRGSWALVEGNRSSLVVLGVLVWVVNTILTGVTLVPALLLSGPAGVLVGQAGTALASVFTLATTARTYVQLVDEGGMEALGAPGEEREVRSERLAE